MCNFTQKSTHMKYNIGTKIVILETMGVKKVIDSEIIANKEIYYTSDKKSYCCEQIFSEYSDFIKLKNTLTTNKIHPKKFVNVNLISEGLIRTFKKEKKSWFFNLRF